MPMKQQLPRKRPMTMSLTRPRGPSSRAAASTPPLNVPAALANAIAIAEDGNGLSLPCCFIVFILSIYLSIVIFFSIFLPILLLLERPPTNLCCLNGCPLDLNVIVYYVKYINTYICGQT